MIFVTGDDKLMILIFPISYNEMVQVVDFILDETQGRFVLHIQYHGLFLRCHVPLLLT